MNLTQASERQSFETLCLLKDLASSSHDLASQKNNNKKPTELTMKDSALKCCGDFRLESESKFKYNTCLSCK